jgi:hypothetical protein
MSLATEAPTPDVTSTPAATPRMSAAELCGRWIGRALAPAFGLVARLRGARALHPTGTVCAAEVVATAQDPLLVPLARRLAGAAVVRLSGALWREPGPPELLGCAVRFRQDRPLTPTPAPEDQDVLLATARAPWTALPAMFTTDRGDYLHNTYFTMSPLAAPGLGRFELRLVPAPRVVRTGGSRVDRLTAAMTAGTARLRLEIRRERRGWQPLCDLRLRGRLAVDEQALDFTPYHTGAELQPQGFVQALRRATYAASRAGRV